MIAKKKKVGNKKTKTSGHEKIRGIGVANHKKEIYLFYESGKKIFVAKSDDGYRFSRKTKKMAVTGLLSIKSESPRLKISESKNSQILTYISGPKSKRVLNIASSKNAISWKKVSRVANIKEAGMVVPDYAHNKNHTLYFGEKNICTAFSKDLKKWDIIKLPVLTPRENYFDNHSLEVGKIFTLTDGILIIYYVKNGKSVVSVGAALFDKENPTHLRWRADEPIWEKEEGENAEALSPIGIAQLENSLIFYWSSASGIVASAFNNLLPWIKNGRVSARLSKFEGNPVMRPHQEHSWESRATFNPAALYENDTVHLLYRAIGDQDLSVIGYASSKNGFNFDERLDKPAYVDMSLGGGILLSEDKHVSPFTSGGGCFGGCEDPRITRIGDKVYMLYVAYDGWSPPRIALTSISYKNFLDKNWQWKKPKIISQPPAMLKQNPKFRDIVDKNACLLPEKIDGKYVIFHRIFPDILVDFVDDLDFKNSYLEGRYKISPRPHYWDSRKIGAGAPPIKTKDGWLLIYQAVGEQDSGRYKLGAMLLDLKNPSHVLYRSRQPILEPNEHYENSGHKSGVAYPCGAVVIDTKLLVYYGGADTVVCVAEANLDDFLRELKNSEKAVLGKPVAVEF